jgi:hypothetical protein
MQIPLPGVGDLIDLFMAWRETKRESRERTLELLKQISAELDSLAGYWRDIVSDLRGGGSRNSVIEKLSEQRSHFEALQSFCKFIKNDQESGSNIPDLDSGQILLRILNNALAEKGELSYWVRNVINPGQPIIEESSAEYDEESMRGRTSNYYSQLNPDDEQLDPADRILARRAQWSQNGLEEETRAEDSENIKLRAAALANIENAVEQLSGYAGEFRAAVALFETQ